MERTLTKCCKGEQGFTLVELAIVMIIIGLLITGVLKGQEMIANAQVTSTVAQAKGYEAATTTFRDTYNAFPGDMLAPNTRLPNCLAAPCSTPGNGNSRLSDVAGALPVIPAGEGMQYFVHMDAADLIGGITLDGTAGWGDIYPSAAVDGGMFPNYHAGGVLGANANARAGHYLILTIGPTAATGALGNNALNASQAGRIDRKLDDGNSNTGGVFTVNTGCDVAGNAGAYNEANTATACDMVLRIQ